MAPIIEKTTEKMCLFFAIFFTYLYFNVFLENIPLKT